VTLETARSGEIDMICMLRRTPGVVFIASPVPVAPPGEYPPVSVYEGAEKYYLSVAVIPKRF
jgi:5-deoxy-D-glucuronate isomerase